MSIIIVKCQEFKPLFADNINNALTGLSFNLND